MRIIIAASSSACFAVLLSGWGLALAQGPSPDGKQVRVPLAIYHGDGFLSRGRSFERDRNNRCDTRSSFNLSVYDRGKIQYKSVDRTDLRVLPVAEGDIQLDKDPKNSGGQSFSMARRGNNQTFSMVGAISADRARTTGSWTVQTRFNTGRDGGIASTCVYTFDLPRLEAKPAGK